MKPGDNPTSDDQAEFEEKIAALLEVDPKGLSDKHRTEDEERGESESGD